MKNFNEIFQQGCDDMEKAGSHASRKLPGSDGVAVIDDDYTRKFILKQMKLDDVWGVGRKLSQNLSMLGLKTAWDLSCQNPKNMRRQFSVVLERTVEELNGVKCLNWDDVKSPKKEIFFYTLFGPANYSQ